MDSKYHGVLCCNYFVEFVKMSDDSGASCTMPSRFLNEFLSATSFGLLNYDQILNVVWSTFVLIVNSTKCIAQSHLHNFSTYCSGNMTKLKICYQLLQRTADSEVYYFFLFPQVSRALAKMMKFWNTLAFFKFRPEYTYASNRKIILHSYFILAV